MYWYLEGLPGGSDLEKLVKKYKKEIQSHRRISNSSNGADFRSMSVSQFVSDRSLVLYMFRLQLYSILKSDWSGAWLLLPIVTRTVNSIVSAGYSRKIVIMCVKWNLFSKSHSF